MLSLPESLEYCPQCLAIPFRSFMRGQVTRFGWFGFRRAIWAVICSNCKRIVGYEAEPPP